MVNKEKEFYCINCGREVFSPKLVGTAHRNHCPYCLFSVDVDIDPGDRKSKCRGLMKPIGLTFKHEGKDKYGSYRQGELMLIHECLDCDKISINRIAGDDDSDAIMDIFEKSKKLSLLKIDKLRKEGIDVLSEKDKEKISVQLFG